mgnify:CR=1 FL=1
MDWRVAVYNQTNHTDSQTFNWIEEYWMVHDMQRNRITLKQAIRQVVKFLTRTTHEIIIIDFHIWIIFILFITTIIIIIIMQNMKQILFFFTNETKCYDETTGIDDDQDEVETTELLLFLN